MVNKRGQGAIEFMAGYGWILVVITISLISVIWTISNDEVRISDYVRYD